MKINELTWRSKADGKAHGRNEKDVYIGLNKCNGKSGLRVAYSFAKSGRNKLNSQYINISRIVDYKGKKRIYFQPVVPCVEAYKITKTSHTGGGVATHSIKKSEIAAYSMIAQKSYQLIKDNESNLYFIEVH